MFLLITITIGTLGALGVALFMTGDILFKLVLPPMHGEKLIELGMMYGFIWPFGAFIIYLITIGIQVPQRWKDTVAIYRMGSGLLYLGAFTMALSLFFHVIAII